MNFFLHLLYYFKFNHYLFNQLIFCLKKIPTPTKFIKKLLMFLLLLIIHLFCLYFSLVKFFNNLNYLIFVYWLNHYLHHHVMSCFIIIFLQSYLFWYPYYYLHNLFHCFLPIASIFPFTFNQIMLILLHCHLSKIMINLIIYFQ